ncbi:unnamed protein product [Nyctereutes procyonoides]|uniref:(raccoon dog) hypothetical protein n=1 Tax=Nyctereutes procyonoides TaxID=34880 RepID=A0A811XZ49_NYCPR|nr:unnamed protein product [Nyctereutes procyonoides]
MFALKEFGVTGLRAWAGGTPPTLAGGPLEGPSRMEAESRVPGGAERAGKVRDEAELSEVLKPPASVPRAPPPRTPGPSRSAQPGRRTGGPGAANCQRPAPCPDGTVATEPTPPTRDLLLGSSVRASEAPV